MKSIVFSNWNFFRIVRLVLGFVIIGQAVVMKDVIFGIAGLLFSVMAILNVACCGVGGCNVATPIKNVQKTEETTFEEIK